jgi:hypothetical protein
MSFNPKFRFSLRNAAGNYYRVVSGAVVVAPGKVPLKDGPEGWRETGIEYERNPVLHGVFTEYNDGLVFVGDGGKIVRHVFYTGSIEDLLQLEVEIARNSDKSYLPYFIGDIDLSTFRNVTDNGASKVTCKIMKGGLNAAFTASRSIKRAIQIGADALNVNTDGFPIYNQFEFKTFANPADATQITATSTQLAGAPVNWRSTIPAAEVRREGDIGFGSNNGVIMERYLRNTGQDIQGGTSDRMEQYLIQAGRNGDLQFSIKQAMNYENNNGGTGSWILRVLVLVANNNYTPPTEYVIWTDPAGPLAPGQNRNVTIDTTAAAIPMPWIPIVAGQKAFLAYNVEFVVGSGTSLPPTNGFFAWQGGGTYNITARFTLPPTITRGYRYPTAVRKLLALTPGGTFTLTSSLLDNAALSPSSNWDNVPYNNILTSGDALRKLVDGSGYSYLYLSLEDIQRDMFGTEGAGVGINGNAIIIEKLPFFYNAAVEICNLGEVSDYSGEPATELLFNEIELGGEDQTYDKLNGRYEINTGQVSTLPYPTRVKQKGEWRSPINWAIYPQEIARANISEKKTADSKSDNETFGLCTTGNGPILQLYRPAAQNTATGVPNPASIYNVPKTPGRDKLRMIRYLQSLCFRRDGEKIAFQTADKNKEYISNLGAGTVVEKADITLPAAAPLFIPYFHTGTFKIPSNFYQLLAANPYGYICFTKNGVPFKGFVWKASQKDAQRAAQEIKLLAHPDTDITLLK